MGLQGEEEEEEEEQQQQQQQQQQDGQQQHQQGPHPYAHHSIMSGVDEMEVETNILPSGTIGAMMSRALEALHGKGIVVSSTQGGKPFSDYNPRWAVFVHVTSFPWGDGALDGHHIA